MADNCHDYSQKLEEQQESKETIKREEIKPDSEQSEKQYDNFIIPTKMTIENEPVKMMYYDAKEKFSVATDHCYARPWNWKPESSFLRPTKTLFIPKAPGKLKYPGHLNTSEDKEENIDVESVQSNPLPIYDVGKANQLMEECEKHIKLFKTTDGNNNWEEEIIKHNWTPTQTRIFNGIVGILNNHYLAKLASGGLDYEAIYRRTAIDKSVGRIRRLMSTIFWDLKLSQWLHQLLVDNLNTEYLAMYMEILQTLKAKVPSFVEKMIYGQTAFKIGAISTENLLPILKRPWDPVISSLMQDKPKKLPGNPVLVVVPSSPVTSSRYLKWINLLSNLATVVNVPCNLGTPAQRLTTMLSADQIFASIRGQVQEIKNQHPNKNVVLIGFNAGAAMALQIAQIEPVLAVVCLSFSLLTAEGKRGEPEDTLMELQCPVLFVIGQCSPTSSQEDMEDLRERMRVETGLVVVGSADEYLRINKKKKRSEGITQSVVDRCIVDEIGEFISGIILSPYPPQIRQSPTHTAIDPTIIKKSKIERKRYNSNTSSLDSEDHMSPLPPRISRPVGRPPGSKTKSRLEIKWAAQVAQAKMQAYGMAKHNIIAGSRLSSLLQGGIKTIPPTQPKPPGPTIRVLENVTLSTGNSKIVSNAISKTVNVITPGSNIKPTGANVILLPDGKIKTIGPSNIIKGHRYITSKKQLLANRPPKPAKKMVSYKPLPNITSNLPPPTNLTTQDIMDLPIIFADDDQIIDAPPTSNITPPAPPPPPQQTATPIIPTLSTPKLLTPGSKFVLVNKPINLPVNSTNFVISQAPIKKIGNVYRQTPKYTKIILSKRTDELKSSGVISRIANLSPEISVKKIGNPVTSSSASLNYMDNIDLETELVATTIAKPMYSGDFKNITITQKAVSSQSESYIKTLERIRQEKLKRAPSPNDDDDSDPDYIPPKIIKLN